MIMFDVSSRRLCTSKSKYLKHFNRRWLGRSIAAQQLPWFAGHSSQAIAFGTRRRADMPFSLELNPLEFCWISNLNFKDLVCGELGSYSVYRFELLETLSTF